MPRKKPNAIGGQFVPHLIEMLESDAWAELTLASRRVLDRLEIEHSHHGGKENGKLVCTYGQLADFGIRRPSIAGAIQQLVSLGFVEVTHKGRGGNSAKYKKDPSLYRLTYLRTARAAPTDDWRRFVAPPQKNGSPAEIIDSGHENVTGSVGTKTYLEPVTKTYPVPVTKTYPVFLFFEGLNGEIPNLNVMAGATLCPVWPKASGGASRSLRGAA